MPEFADHHNKDSPIFQNNHGKKAKVSIVKAYDCDCGQIQVAVEKGIELIGGLGKIVKPGNKVFGEINHLSPPSPAARGIVTHPIFVEAVLEVLQEVGAKITANRNLHGTIIQSSLIVQSVWYLQHARCYPFKMHSAYHITIHTAGSHARA